VDSARTTTTSCWFAARAVAVFVILSGLFLQAGSGQELPVAGMPAQLPGTPLPLPKAAPTIRWTVAVPAAPIASPIVTGEVVIVAYLPGILAGHHRDDGRLLWRAELNPEQPPATDGTLLFVSADDQIHALGASDGAVAWRVPAVPLTAPLLVKDGWLIAASAGKLTARRTTNGSIVWTVDAGVQRELGAISGDVLFVPQADGRVVARDLANGQVRWERRLGGAPGEPLVIGDDVFVGATDKIFYCLDAGSGEDDWKIRVGAAIRGRASSEGERVFFAALDNMVRAVDRGNGGGKWQKGVPFRPLGGPVTAAGSVFIAGPETISRLLAASGDRGASITFPHRMALGPGFAQTEGGIVFAAITGGLEESWKLSLTSPID
jgi:outer membrane protein assembly factor BamB